MITFNKYAVESITQQIEPQNIQNGQYTGSLTGDQLSFYVNNKKTVITLKNTLKCWNNPCTVTFLNGGISIEIN